jgi:hypothetical protein
LPSRLHYVISLGSVACSIAESNVFAHARPISTPYTVSDPIAHWCAQPCTIQQTYATAFSSAVARTISVALRASYAVSDTASIARTVAVALRAPEPSSFELTDTFALKCTNSSSLRHSNTIAVARTEPCADLGADAFAIASSFASAHACPHSGSFSVRCCVSGGIVHNDDAY